MSKETNTVLWQGQCGAETCRIVCRGRYSSFSGEVLKSYTAECLIKDAMGGDSWQPYLGDRAHLYLTAIADFAADRAWVPV